MGTVKDYCFCPPIIHFLSLGNTLIFLRAVVLRTAASALPANLLEMQILIPARPLDSETLVLGSATRECAWVPLAGKGSQRCCIRTARMLVPKNSSSINYTTASGYGTRHCGGALRALFPPCLWWTCMCDPDPFQGRTDGPGAGMVSR